MLPAPFRHNAEGATRLLYTRALAPLRLAKIAFSRVRPSSPIVMKDFSEFAEHFRSNPHSPASESFPCGPRGPLFLPSSAHRGNFEQVRPLYRHGTKSDAELLRTCCLMAAKISQFLCGQKAPTWIYPMRKSFG